MARKNGFGIARFKWSGGSIPWVVRRAVAEGMGRAAEHVKRTMRRLINVPYPPASLPGESPHRRTGNLRRSINIWLNKQTLQVWVGPTDAANYGIYLEYGTKRMAPRPFMFKALKQEGTKVKNIMQRAAVIAFNKHAKAKLKKR